MKLLTPSNLGLLAATLLTAPLSAQVSLPPEQQQRPPLPAPRGGLRVEIMTARVKVVVPPAGEAADQQTDTQAAPKGLPVSGLVANMSRDDLSIAFTSAKAAERHLTFSLYNSARAELWNSDSELADADDVEAVLPKRKAWRRLELVPLIVNETPLTPGVYTVEVSVGADKIVGAAATFEVVEAGDQPPAPPREEGETTRPQQPPRPPSDETDGQQLPPPPRPQGSTDGEQQPPPPRPGGSTDGQQQPPHPRPGVSTDGEQQPPPPRPGGSTDGQQQPPPPRPGGSTDGQQQPPPPRPGGSTDGQQQPPPPRPSGQQPPQR